VIYEEPSKQQIHPNCTSSQSHPSLVAHQSLGGGVNLWEVSVSGRNDSGTRGILVIQGGRSSIRRYQQSLEESQISSGLGLMFTSTYQNPGGEQWQTPS
jgi:hypothetical protein